MAINITPELKEKLANAKSAAEITRILALGDIDSKELKLDDLEQVSGGGHYVSDGNGQRIWIELIDKGYVYGTDEFYDKAYILENMAVNGCTLDELVNVADVLFSNLVAPGGNTPAVAYSLKQGGPAYLADCYRDAGHGYSW